MSASIYFIIVPLLFLSSLFNNQEKPIEDPDEICAVMYGKAMSHHQAAQMAKKNGQDRLALTNYYKSIVLLKNVQTVNPDWNGAAVRDKIKNYEQLVKLLEETVEEKERIYRQTLAKLQENLEKEPGNYRAHVELGDFYFNYGKLKAAERCLRRALEIERNDAQTRIKLGNAFEAQGKYREAISEYRKALILDPESASAHYNLGFARFMENRNTRLTNNDAIAELKRAIEIDPEYIDAYLSLGMIYNRQKQYKLALARLKQAYLLEPDNPVINYNLGSTYCSLLNFVNAVNYMNKAVDLVGRDTQMGQSISRQIKQLRRYNLVGQEGRGYRDRKRMLIYKGRTISGPRFRRWKRRRDRWIDEYQKRYI